MFLSHPSIPARGLLMVKVCVPGQPGWIGGTGGQVHCGKLAPYGSVHTKEWVRFLNTSQKAMVLETGQSQLDPQEPKRKGSGRGYLN